MTEQRMRQRVVKALKSLDAHSVENPCRPGTPDINFVEGWMELKWAKKWPTREGTPFRCEHFTPQQRVWLLARRRAGGRAFVLLQVGSDCLLFDGADAALYLGKTTRGELWDLALTTFPSADIDAQLLSFLKSYSPPTVGDSSFSERVGSNGTPRSMG